MPKQNHHKRILAFTLSVLSILLTIPRFNQMKIVLRSILSYEDYTFFIENNIIVFIVILIEIGTSFFNVFILHFIYKFAKQKITISENMILYFISASISKIFSLLISASLKLNHALLNSILFTLPFLGLHLWLFKKENGTIKIKNTLWMLIFPIANILIHAL